MIVGSNPTTSTIFKSIAMEKDFTMIDKIVRKIPSSENGINVLCTTKSGQKYKISQNKEKVKFTLWKIEDKGFLKIKTASSPVNLYDLIPWDQ